MKVLFLRTAWGVDSGTSKDGVYIILFEVYGRAVSAESEVGESN